MNILGISALYHDSAAVLLRDGEIVAAAQEERFTRRKHDHGFPIHAIRYCLTEGDLRQGKLDAVAFYDKPLTKFARIMETYFSVAPRGLRSFVKACPLWMKQKLWIPYIIESTLKKNGFDPPRDLIFTEHHESHAASAFFPSPFDRAAVVTLDGVGEWATSSIAQGQDNSLECIKELRFPHSLGLLYSAFTTFTGFKVNSGEYKLMGLAPYGKPTYTNLIRDELLDIREDGSFRLNMDYFGYLNGLAMTNRQFAALFGGPPRKPESEITQREMDLASSIQHVTEEIVLCITRHAHEITGETNLCMAGGVALNCVANGRVIREGPFENVWIQPAAGDAGGALGAACVAHHVFHRQPRRNNAQKDAMRGARLGPAYSDDEIADFLATNGHPARKLSPDEWATEIARLIDEQKVVGLFQGRMEFGPRALGARSILADARSSTMQSMLNRKIKFRESFRPFAPACLPERAADYFDLDQPSPYMLLTAPLRPEHRQPGTTDRGSIVDRVNQVRSDVPAVTHVDYSARVQTVDRATAPHFHAIIKAFEARTGCGLIINTSFNVRGEPIVCTPADAYTCFMRTGMDHLVLGSYLLDKRTQPVDTTSHHPWQNDVPD